MIQAELEFSLLTSLIRSATFFSARPLLTCYILSLLWISGSSSLMCTGSGREAYPLSMRSILASVVKVPKSGDFEREQFRKELKIYEIFSQHPPCPSIVQCFLYADNGIFLEYMRGARCNLYWCLTIVSTNSLIRCNPLLENTK